MHIVHDPGTFGMLPDRFTEAAPGIAQAPLPCGSIGIVA